VQIAEGLVLLGSAFKERDRRTWAEELFRLGLVFVRDGAHAGGLFYHLGLLLSEEERYGEAIGHLRRALALGVEAKLIFPALGRAFLRRRKFVPAAALLEGALAHGADTVELSEDLALVRGEFARAGVRWNVPPRDSEPPGA
jgi:tetratricopeptide (TPR) repeat protein